jgi:hypothetical protein
VQPARCGLGGKLVALGDAGRAVEVLDDAAFVRLQQGSARGAHHLGRLLQLLLGGKLVAVLVAVVEAPQFHGKRHGAEGRVARKALPRPALHRH